MTKTKEELIKEVAGLEVSNKYLVDANNLRLKDFAKAFGWYKKDFYSNEKELRLPSWPEVFIELGRLMAARDDRDRSIKIENIESQLGELYQDIYKLRNPVT